MSVEAIFKQLHDPTTWPAPPERALVPYDANDLQPAELVPWLPEAAQPGPVTPREAEQGWRRLKAG